MPGRLQFDFTFSHSLKDISTQRRTKGAMRILLMGDFSGRHQRGLQESADKLATRSIAPVDIDNFNETMARIAPQLRLPIGDTVESGMAIQFAQLDDFHPDELYQKLEMFQTLRALRDRLMDPTTFPQAAAELRHETQKPEHKQKQEQAQEGEHVALATDSIEPALEENDDSMLQRLLGKQATQRTQAPSGTRQSEIQTATRQFIQGIVGPYIVADTDPLQPQYVAAVDEAISEQMRSVLHHADFQALEALWRSVHNLVTGLETGEELKLYLLDISKDELAEDIKAAQGQLEESGLYRLLIEKGVVEKGAGALGGEPWSILIGDYSFTTQADDLSLLAALGAIGSLAGGPFLAAADASMLGCRSLVETPDPSDWKIADLEAEQCWLALRQRSVATWIGLAHPRVLLRLPYGKNSDALQCFEFEERHQALHQEVAHESYLWGNPAFTCAMLIAAAYQTNGWSIMAGPCNRVIYWKQKTSLPIPLKKRVNLK